MTRSIDELFAELERTDDRATYEVLADALVEAGDPRGELMRLQLALDGDPMGHEYAPPDRWTRALDRRAPEPDGELRAKRLERHEARELRLRAMALRQGRELELLRDLADEGVKLEWRYGLLDHVRLDDPMIDPLLEDVLRRIFGTPAARMLRSIELGLRGLDPLLVWLRELALPVPSSLRTLIIGRALPRTSFAYVQHEEPETVSLAGVLDIFPGLRELYVDTGSHHAAWERLDSDHLQHLSYVGASVAAAALEPLAQSRLPALRSFVLWTGAAYTVEYRDEVPELEPAGLQPAELEPILAMLDGCPELHHLGLGNYARDVTELVARASAHPFAARIDTLDLSGADRIDARALAAELARFPALRRLVVEGIDLGRGERQALAGEGREVVGGHGDDGERYRTVVCVE